MPCCILCNINKLGDTRSVIYTKKKKWGNLYVTLCNKLGLCIEASLDFSTILLSFRQTDVYDIVSDRKVVLLYGSNSGHCYLFFLSYSTLFLSYF